MQANGVRKFSEIPARIYPRQKTGFDAFDKALGGGIVPGSSLLIFADPGCGKSTLLLQVLGQLSGDGITGAMIHAEESAEQLAARAHYWELKSRDFDMVPYRLLESALPLVRLKRNGFLLVDSLQTVYTKSLKSPEGSLSQIAACCRVLTQYSEKHHITVAIIAHVTKDGDIAGPQTLKHLVDVTLTLEFSESNDSQRILTVIKNRFGPSPLSVPLTITAMGFKQ